MRPLAPPFAPSPRSGLERPLLTLAVGALALFALLAPQAAVPAAAQPTFLPGLDADALIVEDSFGIPTVCAAHEEDAFFLLGYLHARDRFFQMDSLRRLFSGTLAELLGPPALPSDVQLRTLGLRRAAEISLTRYSALSQIGVSNASEVLAAYSEGVNAYLASAPLPPEYAALELTAVDPWTPLDSVTVAKGLAFGLSFDLDDLDRTLAFLTYTGTGQVAGFDGQALFFEDLFRSAPFDDRVSIPGALPALGGAARGVADGDTASGAATTSAVYDERLGALARRYRDTAAAVPELARAFGRADSAAGSNWWVLAGSRTASGFPILANDPHLALDTPSTFYEAHLVVSSQPRCGLPATTAAAFSGTGAPGGLPAGGQLNVNGVTFAGVPGIVQGCNERICWGSTVNPMDVTDLYQEQVVFDPGTGLPRATMYQGQEEPLLLIPQVYRVNQVGDSIPDNLGQAPLGPTEGGLTLVVPRRNNGPIVDLDLSSQPAVGISVQYTGWSATAELTAFLGFMRAGSVDDFRNALQFFDVGSQNWAYADVDGNIAYFTSAEMPLREDLQTLNFPDGNVPPFLIRDGTGALQHEWLLAGPGRPVEQALTEYEILPFEEMPQIVNPASGFIVNANNDPIGTSLDNNPLNQVRPGGGLYYLSPGYVSLRVGRIGRVIDDLLAGGGTATLGELTELQANNQLLDAELLSPYLLNAFVHAGEPGAPAELQALGTDPEINEAIARLRSWDFSTPTGIPEGYDPGDDPLNLPVPSADEVASSVAATLWSTWRGQAIGLTVDQTLQQVGLGGALPGSRSAYVALDHLLTTFDQGQGVGASGLDFFRAPPGYERAEARDLRLLQALREALDLLASNTMDPAFGGSTDQNDYRWGWLHRITFDHLLGPPFSVPPGGGFDDVAPDLPGVARSGGYEAVDASSHSARADGLNEFRFGSGPARRFIGVLDPAGIDAQQVIPGGQSGVPGHPHHADQLPLWLTNHYHPVRISPADVAADAVSEQEFTNTPPPCVPGPNVLCLHDDRFRVTIDWQTAQGTSGAAGVVPVESDRSGILWFFNPDNWEMLVKVLDGCEVNDHFWVFAASATNVEWELTVVDQATGESYRRSNPLGQASPAITDTRAFATCL